MTWCSTLDFRLEEITAEEIGTAIVGFPVSGGVPVRIEGSMEEAGRVVRIEARTPLGGVRAVIEWTDRAAERIRDWEYRHVLIEIGCDELRRPTFRGAILTDRPTGGGMIAVIPDIENMHPQRRQQSN